MSTQLKIEADLIEPQLTYDDMIVTGMDGTPTQDLQELVFMHTCGKNLRDYLLNKYKWTEF